MEEISSGGSSGHLYFAAASTCQLGLGIHMYRRGSNMSQLMPLKAFAVASLFVGASATAAGSIIRYYGIYSVEEMKGVGRNMRKWIRNSS